jgi:hypothetical protein
MSEVIFNSYNTHHRLLVVYQQSKIIIFWNIISIACEMEGVIRLLGAKNYSRMAVDDDMYFQLPIQRVLDVTGWGNHVPISSMIETETIEMKKYVIRCMSDNFLNGDYFVKIGVGHKTKSLLYHCYEKEEIPRWV